MKKGFVFAFVLVFILTSISGVRAQDTTDVGTPRNETLVVQTFDRQTTNPDMMNPLMNFAIWRGFRELGAGFLWDNLQGCRFAARCPLATDLCRTEEPNLIEYRPGHFAACHYADQIS